MKGTKSPNKLYGLSCGTHALEALQLPPCYFVVSFHWEMRYVNGHHILSKGVDLKMHIRVLRVEKIHQNLHNIHSSTW